MDALILAAGYGSRLRDVAPSKPLARLHGVSLLELSLRQLAAVGVTRAIVTTGYRAAEVEAVLPAIAARTGIEIAARRVAAPDKPNGHSVLAGSADFDGPFLLVMADHLFSTAVLRTLVANAPDGFDAVVAIDKRVASPLVDPSDATWVTLDRRGALERIGKGLDRYDAVDCGAFVATPALPRAIAATIRGGREGSLSDGMQHLADRGRAGAVDIGDAWWMDVDDEKTWRLASVHGPRHLAALRPRSEPRRQMATA